MALVNVDDHRLSQLHTLRFSIGVSRFKPLGVVPREYDVPDGF